MEKGGKKRTKQIRMLQKLYKPKQIKKRMYINIIKRRKKSTKTKLHSLALILSSRQKQRTVS